MESELGLATVRQRMPPLVEELRKRTDPGVAVSNDRGALLGCDPQFDAAVGQRMEPFNPVRAGSHGGHAQLASRAVGAEQAMHRDRCREEQAWR
jgi:hypothetical protein